MLGLPTFTALEMVQKLEAMYNSSNDMKREFLFLYCMVNGTLGERYSIKLREPTPRALFIPRNVPIPLKEKVREE